MKNYFMYQHGPYHALVRHARDREHLTKMAHLQKEREQLERDVATATVALQQQQKKEAASAPHPSHHRREESVPPPPPSTDEPTMSAPTALPLVDATRDKAPTLTR